jgi:hypothetical protein
MLRKASVPARVRLGKADVLLASVDLDHVARQLAARAPQIDL